MKYTFKADGEPNFYTIFCENRWYMKVQMNGELTVFVQECLMQIMVAALK